MGMHALHDTTMTVVLNSGLTPLDRVGPLQILSALSRMGPSARTTVVAERVDVMATDMPPQLALDSTSDAVPHPDGVILPGGGVPTLHPMASPAGMLKVAILGRAGDLGLLQAGPASPAPASPSHPPAPTTFGYPPMPTRRLSKAPVGVPRSPPAAPMLGQDERMGPTRGGARMTDDELRMRRTAAPRGQGTHAIGYFTR